MILSDFQPLNLCIKVVQNIRVKKKIRHNRTPIKNDYVLYCTVVGNFTTLNGTNEEEFNEFVNKEFVTNSTDL